MCESFIVGKDWQSPYEALPMALTATSMAKEKQLVAVTVDVLATAQVLAESSECICIAVCLNIYSILIRGKQQ